MRRIDLSLSRFSLAQKLDLMETLWSDLAAKEEFFESPPWHAAELRARGRAAAAGKAGFSDWEHAKKRINRAIHADPDPRRR